jgi:YVTN family beta-propeller protein
MMLMLFPLMTGCGNSGGGGGGSTSGGSSATTETYRYAYVTNFGDNTLGFISLSDNSYKEVKLANEKTVGVGNGPAGVSVEARGSSVYVTSMNDSAVAVVNVLNKAVVGGFNPGKTPIGIDFGPFVDGFAAIANSGDGTIAIYNTKIGTIDTMLTPGGSPQDVSCAPDNLKAYVSNTNNTISIVDITSAAPVLGTPISGVGNSGLDVDSANTYIYSADNKANLVYKVNIGSSSVESTITVGQAPNGVVCHPKNTGLVYVTNTTGNSVSVISTATNTVTATIPVGTSPDGIAITADGSRLYVANSGSNNVSVIDTSTNAVVTTVTVGNTPTAICTSPF